MTVYLKLSKSIYPKLSTIYLKLSRGVPKVEHCIFLHMDIPNLHIYILRGIKIATLDVY